MRISPEQKDDIIELVRKEISQQARVWLFGSRVRDDARGGDIDLLIEIDGLSNLVEKKTTYAWHWKTDGVNKKWIF
ncbi:MULTISPECIES: nucleotidyltransferase domain-containing protein [unclassified Endozoicomonas]|uniref:nucleotidyltransferase domain-containing protein n=1 Tax=unclassified Endozoicomonas TaxID=2644528 RepID=UPI003BB20F6C